MPKKISDQPMGVGFPHRSAEGFCPGVVEIFIVDMWENFWPGDGTLYSPGAVESRRSPDSLLSPRAGSMNSSQSTANRQSKGGGSTSCRAVSIRRIIVFVPGSLGLYMRRGIPNRGMGPCPPHMLRDLGVGPRVNTSAGRWLCKPRPIIIRGWRVGFPSVWGGIDPEDHRVRPWVVGFSYG